MMEEVHVINQTMELTDCKAEWMLDEKYGCWCLEDILYTARATTPKFQRMSIFVPEPYMKAGGEIDPEGTVNGYQAKTAPVIFCNNSAGYMQMPHWWLDGPRCTAPQFLERGFVVVTCGNRGSESRDGEGRLCGKSPINLVDLKTAIRFLRHNAKALPGDFAHIISTGWSAGGAMSALLAVTGNNQNYLPYLEENGAFMEESDAIYAAQIYCPIVDLEHADLAYEWMFSADKENEDSPAGPAGVMDAFREALSGELKKKYITYFNQLGLVHPETGEPLLLGEDGRSGSAYAYFLRKLEEAAEEFLKRLEKGELEEQYSTEDYLKGNYEYETMAHEGPKTDGGEEKANIMQGHAGPGVALAEGGAQERREGEPKEAPTLGDMLSRPPKGVAFQGHKPPMVMVRGRDKTAWLSWDGERARISDLDSYVLQHRGRMKPCTSFDTLGMDSGENRVFGSAEKNYMHFNHDIADAIASIREDFPVEYEKYYRAYAENEGDEELKKRIYLVNPLEFIGTEEKSDMAKHYRIRVGASDADTSLSVGMTLALKLAAAGKPVDYALIWDKPHCEADYPGELCDWIEKIGK